MIKFSQFKPAGLSLALLLAACPKHPEPVYTPPTPSPIFTPSPSFTSSPTPVNSPSSGPTPLPPLQLTELPDGNLISDSFRLEFGPGSKGVKLEFGPGTKGPELEFGPGTKGPQNLELQLEFPDLLVNTGLQGFQLQQQALAGVALSQLNLEIVRDNQLYATAKALPRRSKMTIPARFHPGTYSISVLTETASGTRHLSWNQLEILPEFNAQLKVAVYADSGLRPEDFDIELVSRNRIPRN